MDVLGRLEAQGAEKLQMEGQAGEPFIAADHMGRAHEMVVHRVGEVVSRDAVGFQQHLVDVVFRHRQDALDQIGVFELILNGAGGTEPQDPGLSGVEGGLNVLHGTVAPDGVGAVVAEVDLFGLLVGAHLGQLLLRAEAGVGVALLNQLFRVDVVDVRPLPLTVGAVVAAVAGLGGALVKADAVVGQSVDEHLHSARHLSLGVGVLHPQEENAAALVGHTFGDQALNQIAQMDKACGRGGHAGDDRALGDLALGEARLQLLRRGGHMGKQKLCKFHRVHCRYLVSFGFSAAGFAAFCMFHYIRRRRESQWGAL